jgi:hypothetical protein
MRDEMAPARAKPDEGPGEACELFAKALFAISADGPGDGVDAVDMDHHALRHEGVDGRLDRGAQTRAVQVRADEGDTGFTRRIILGEGIEDGLMIERHEDVARECILQPGAGRLDPHDAVLLQGRVAACGLHQQGIRTHPGRERAELIEFYHRKESIT